MNVYNLDQALKELRSTSDEVTHYALGGGGTWMPATNGCVPWNAMSFKTKQGAYWNIHSGWASGGPHKFGELVLPEDPKHPMNAENAHYRIPIAVLAILPEQMQKDFHIIRERVDQVCHEEKEARLFAEYVKAEMAKRNMRLSTPFDTDFQYLLRDAYGKFKRS